MESRSKKVFVKKLLGIFRLSKFVIKIYPLAIENVFYPLRRERINELRRLLPLSLGQSITWKRFGSDGDGGYMMHDDILSSDICLSFGVGDNFSFDLDIAKKCHEVWMFDHTVNNLKISQPNIKFNKIGISHQKSYNYTTMDEILKKVPSDIDIILKMDIEGSEWKVLSNLDDTLFTRFRQIIVEFHDLHKILNNQLFSEITQTLEKLNKSHKLINGHINNWSSFQLVAGVPFPDVIEATYLRRDSESLNDKNLTLIENLGDMPNNPDVPNYSANFLSLFDFG